MGTHICSWMTDVSDGRELRRCRLPPAGIIGVTSPVMKRSIQADILASRSRKRMVCNRSDCFPFSRASSRLPVLCMTGCASLVLLLTHTHKHKKSLLSVSLCIPITPWAPPTWATIPFHQQEDTQFNHLPSFSPPKNPPNLLFQYQRTDRRPFHNIYTRTSETRGRPLYRNLYSWSD